MHRIVCLALCGVVSGLPMARADSPTATSADKPATQPAPSVQPAVVPASLSLFDPARHMRVGEVKPGMKGYFLTVISGRKIERFDCEVISVLHNSFGPQQDVVMIRVLGDLMAHYGPIAGCSGSPVYLYDEFGKARLIGAYAYGFDFAKDPIIGVQPIEYMMTLTKPPPGLDDTGTKDVGGVTPKPLTWSLLDANVIPRLAKPREAKTQVEPTTGPRFKSLAVPLAIRGLSPTAAARLAPLYRDAGFEPMVAVGASTEPTTQPTKIEPGSVLGAAVLGGDVEMTALGTCTEVIDGRAFGFGHPFNGEGATSIPMGAGAVNLVMPTQASSFKLGGIDSPSGAIDLDGAYGIAGQIGTKATTVPIRVEVVNAERGKTRTFNYRAALHRTFSPMMIATALESSVTADQQLPVEHTAHYRVTLHFAGGREVTLEDVGSSLSGVDVARDTIWPVTTMMNNPFRNVPIERVDATVTIENGVHDAQIQSAVVAVDTLKPGETAKVHLRLRQYQGPASTKTIDVPLPETLGVGDYTITLNDVTSHLVQMSQLEPYRFQTRNVDELFSAIQSLGSEQHGDRLYVRLSGAKQDLTIGRTALKRLPPSRRAVLAVAARPDTAIAAESVAFEVPMNGLVEGSAEVTIHVKRKLPW